MLQPLTTHALYQSAPDFRAVCAAHFAAFVAEGQSIYPDSRPSHLCVRSADLSDYAMLGQYAAELGETHKLKDRDILWVQLDEPLQHGEQTIDWLELTAPDPEKQHPTGPQMLVFAQDNFLEEPVKTPSQTDARFTLRLQKKSAEAILNPVV